MKTVQSMLAEAEAAVPRIIRRKPRVARPGRRAVSRRSRTGRVAASGKVPGAGAIPRGLVEFRADPASAMHDARWIDPRPWLPIVPQAGARRWSAKP